MLFLAILVDLMTLVYRRNHPPKEPQAIVIIFQKLYNGTNHIETSGNQNRTLRNLQSTLYVIKRQRLSTRHTSPETFDFAAQVIQFAEPRIRSSRDMPFTYIRHHQTEHFAKVFVFESAEQTAEFLAGIILV